MEPVEFDKNRIDMDYQQELQKYQVVCGAVYIIPLTIIGIALSQGFTSNNFLFGSVFAVLSFVYLDDKKEKTENKLSGLKGKVTRLEKKYNVKS